MELPFIKPGTSIILYGETGHGKTTQASALAKHIFRQSGKKTVVFLADYQGSAWAYEENPAIDRILTPTDNRWLWVAEAFQNKYRGEEIKDVGLIIHEGLTAYAELVLDSCAQMAGEGVNIGGGGAHNITLYPAHIPVHVVGEKLMPIKPLSKEDKLKVLKVGSNNMTHYGVSQDAIKNGLKAERGNIPTLFTSMEGLAKPKASSPGVIGPATVGDAQVRHIPKWATYTFRIYQKAGKTTLYLQTHEPGPRTEAVVNPRIPEEGASVKVPASICPASLPEAMTLLHKRRQAAHDEVAGGGE